MNTHYLIMLWKVVVCAHIRHLLEGNFFFESACVVALFKDCEGHLLFSLLLDNLAWEKNSSAKGIKCE